jgi:sugar lactone lactonase YvrE
LNVGFLLFLFGAPFAHAGDNVYMSNTGAGTITQINSAGSASIFASGLNSPEGLAFDGAGNLYVADSGDGTILKIDSAGNVSTFASGLNGPAALAFGQSGNLYVATPANQSILKIDSSGNKSVFATGIAFNTDGAHLTTDNAGNVYANTDFTIERFDSNGNRSTVASIGPGTWQEGMAVDAAGQLYVAWQDPGIVQGNGGLKTAFSDFPAPCATDFHAGSDRPSDLAFDANGNLYAYFGLMIYGSGTGVDNGVLIEFGANGDNSVVATDVAGTSSICGYIAIQPALEAVPEPATWTMVSGLAAVLCLRRRRSRQQG